MHAHRHPHSGEVRLGYFLNFLLFKQIIFFVLFITLYYKCVFGLFHAQVKSGTYVLCSSYTGDPHSSVHLSVHNGSIEGHIKVDGSLFHIEPASKYLNSPIFHTVIYPDTHLDKDPYRCEGLHFKVVFT